MILFAISIAVFDVKCYLDNYKLIALWAGMAETRLPCFNCFVGCFDC